MNSKKNIWGWRAKSVRVTRSGSLTREDAREICEYTGKPALQPSARKVVKKLLRKKLRNNRSLFLD